MTEQSFSNLPKFIHARRKSDHAAVKNKSELKCQGDFCNPKICHLTLRPEIVQLPLHLAGYVKELCRLQNQLLAVESNPDGVQPHRDFTF